VTMVFGWKSHAAASLVGGVYAATGTALASITAAVISAMSGARIVLAHGVIPIS